MGDKRNYAALEWVIGEIGETLKEARQSLEAYVEDPRDIARIRFCLTHIHQVHGSLQMVEFHGGSLFAEEMESLAEALMQGSVTNEKEAQEALMRSLLQLPLYLEQVKNHHEDHPGTVLPLLNDLRAVRKQSYLSETNLFNPDLSSIDKVTGQQHAILQDKAKLKGFIKKFREMYQYAAASVLRGVKVDESLGYIEKVLSRMEGLTRGTLSHPLWQVAAALSEALVRDDVELSIAVRGLLRYIARELRILEEHCPAALHAPARESLLRNLLYYVARADDGGARVAQVKQQYALNNALLGGSSAGKPSNKGMISPPEPDAIRSVVLALQDELNTCKHLLDAALSGQGSLSDVEQMMPYVKRIADTLAVLGIGEMRKQMMIQYDALASIVEAGTYDDIQLIDIAGALAHIEHRLEAIAKGAGKVIDYANVDERLVEIDSAKEAVLAECRVGLEKVKDAIVESLSAQWEPSHLPPAVETLHYIQGGLNMVPLARSARVMGLCGDYIENNLISRTAMPGSELQTLAEAIVSIDYYLERLAAGHSDDLDSYLDMAEDAIVRLGYDIARDDSTGEAASAEVSPELLQEPGVDELVDGQAEAETQEGDRLSGSDDANDYVEEEALSVADRDESGFDETLIEQEEPATGTDELELEGGAETDASLEGPEPSEAEDLSLEPAETRAVTGQDDDENEIDDEIIEIFVEEVAEVQETLAEYFPQWCNNLDDQEALTTVRRAFHTLKGSGRMVEAFDVGELAWSIENMLNRVIDGSVEPTPAHLQMIERVLTLVPELVTAFEQKRPNPAPDLHSQYIDWANRLSKGEIPDNFWSGKAQSDALQVADAEAADLRGDDTGDTEEDSDEQALWEVFASEALTHLAVVDEFLAEMERAAPIYTPPSDTLQRALHTLKGSAHMAAVTPIASLIAPLEGFIKELRSYQVAVDEDTLQLISDAANYTREGLTCIDRREPVGIPKLEQFVARVQELLDRHITPLIHLHEGGQGGPKAVDPRLLSLMMAEEMALLLDADALLNTWQQDSDRRQQQLPQMVAELGSLAMASEQANLPDMSELARQLENVHRRLHEKTLPFETRVIDALGSAHEHLLDMVDQVAAGQDVQPAPDRLLEALRSLLSEPLPQNVATEEDYGAETDDSEESDEPSITAFASSEDLEQAIIGINESPEAETETEEPTEVLTEADNQWIIEQYGDSADEEEVIDFSTSESVEEEPPILIDEELIEESPRQPTVDDEHWYTSQYDEELLIEPEDSHLHEEAPLHEAADMGPASWHEEQEGRQADTTDFAPYLAEEAGIEHAEKAGSESAETPSESDSETDDGFTAAVETEEHQAEVRADDAPLEPELPDEYPEDESASVEPAAVVERDFDKQGAASSEVNIAELTVEDLVYIDEKDFDPDILEIFLEEANELVEELDEAINDWESDWENAEPLDVMKRALHTLKGGARLSGLMNLGELTHEYESFLIQNSSPHNVPNYFQVLLAYQDRVHNGVKGVRATLDGEPLPEEPMMPPPAEVASSEELSHEQPVEEVEHAPNDADADQHVEESEETADAEVSSAQIVPFARKSSLTPTVSEDGEFLTPQTTTASPAAQPKRQGPQEMIKVSADLLEELVNLAGETSISRGRLEQQISDLSSAVDEVDGTLRRLNEQLRRLDLETEAQVLFRQEQMAAHEDFDPLEMDRYSQLQQLTRSLIESASDLGDLKSTLTDKIKDTETLLLQQSRVNSALQEGLMRSRMVPFSRLVPRLRRIVRQVASELGKSVNFELDNVEGEMDRSVLERMVAPLEHMLRNAVDHGIESPDERVAQGKPETGRILLSLAREGGDILLRLADDGRGIKLDRVREKAVERGLMAPDAPLSDHDVMQFILQAGFSTAENVTQISGRGVGMDVVASEIKQLGGSIVIDSKAGVGSQFTVRLPFTVSVNRALMVQLGNETYAIPLNTIEGIVRVSPFELEHYYSHPDARFEYAGENYQVRHLGSILNDAPLPKLDGQVLPLPVVLVRSAQNTMALQVESLMGSREIVVKSLGPQFAAVQGLSGATVMGDGSVVVILDPHALVRREVALLNAGAHSEQEALPMPEHQNEEPDESDGLKTIMVVDDSVTVRKVTSRFLEREGFNVITAKDGVDALQILQEDVPDLMLLDIEMPRMDGFEVAKNIRSTSRLKHLPIIMITSRTGDKHRQHALSIGVNEYMGKPYQEEQLLRTMETLLHSRKNSA